MIMTTCISESTVSQPLSELQLPKHVQPIVELFQIKIEGSIEEIEKQCIKALLNSFKTHQMTSISSCNLEHLEKLKDVAHKTLLIYSLKPGYEGLATFLIRNEVAIHDSDIFGNTPLHYAAKRNATQHIPSLLEHYGFVPLNQAKEAPLHISIKKGRYEALSCFLDRGKKILIPLKEEGITWTPLALAVKYGKQKCVDRLLDKELLSQLDDNLLFKEVGGIGTLLHVAVQYQHPEILEYLLYSKKVIDCLKAKENSFKKLIERKNSDGLTPLALAAKLGDVISIRLLHEKGAFLDTKDYYQYCPIHHAVQEKQYEAVKLLVMLGADSKAGDYEAKTPLEMIRNDTSKKGKSICGFLSSALSMKKDFIVELHQRMPENYVFKGGGPKGIAYAGVIRYMWEKGILPLVKRYAGTSAGSFPVILLSIATPPGEIIDLVKTTNILDYLDPPGNKNNLIDLFNSKVDGVGSALKTIWNLLKSIRSTKEILLKPLETLKKLYNLTGICEGEAFRKWAEERVKKMTGIDYCTYGELRRAIDIEGKPYKHFSIFGTRLQDEKDKSCSVKFSTEDPECDNIIISDTWRISMSIPGVFRPHVIHAKENGKRVAKPHLGQFVDGGMLNNLPMETFDYKGYKASEVLGEKGAFPVFNKRTVGFDLCSDEEEEKKDPEQVKTVIDLLKCLAHVYMEAEGNIRRLNPYASSRIAKINVGKVGLLSFDINDQGKNIIDQSGYKSIKDHFETSIFQATQSSSANTLLKADKGFIAIPPALPPQSFDGREKHLKSLEAFCLPQSWTPKSKTAVALLNEKELDKKEIALAFAHAHVEDFSILKLINCETEESLIQGYRELADILHIYWKENSIQDLHKELETTSFTEKGQEKPWLLLLENVTLTTSEIISALPKNGGVVLILSNARGIWKDEVFFETQIGQKEKLPANIIPGLTIQATCVSESCKKVTWIQKGIGEFSLGEVIFELAGTKCQSCQKAVVKITNLGLFDCKYDLKGIQTIPNQHKVEKTNVIAEKKFTLLLENDKSVWASLNITTKNRK